MKEKYMRKIRNCLEPHFLWRDGRNVSTFPLDADFFAALLKLVGKQDEPIQYNNTLFWITGVHADIQNKKMYVTIARL